MMTSAHKPPRIGVRVNPVSSQAGSFPDQAPPNHQPEDTTLPAGRQGLDLGFGGYDPFELCPPLLPRDDGLGWAKAIEW